jgi:hypothetical protein
VGLLSDSDIASMRGTAAEALPSTATIFATTEKSDGQGGREGGETPRAVDVPCRIDPARKKGEPEGMRGGRTSASYDVLITFEAGTVVLATDVVDVEGRRYEVNLVRDRAEWELTKRVMATGIDVGGPAGEG